MVVAVAGHPASASASALAGFVFAVLTLGLVSRLTVLVFDVGDAEQHRVMFRFDQF